MCREQETTEPTLTARELEDIYDKNPGQFGIGVIGPAVRQAIGEKLSVEPVIRDSGSGPGSSGRSDG